MKRQKSYLTKLVFSGSFQFRGVVLVLSNIVDCVNQCLNGEKDMKKVNMSLVTAIIFSSSMFLVGCGGSSLVTESSNESEEVSSQEETTTESTYVNESGLSEQEVEGLLFMREEEELARDLYMDIYYAKGSRLNTFKNISQNAETSHAEAIRVLLEKYGIDDPSTGVHNTYSDEELQHLYDNLLSIAIGSDDLAALRVGALVEETDISDINAHKGRVSTEHQDIIDTYENLLCGSRNHLRAYAKNIQNITGQPYVTQVPELDSEVTVILNSDKEQCGQ